MSLTSELQYGPQTREQAFKELRLLVCSRYHDLNPAMERPRDISTAAELAEELEVAISQLRANCGTPGSALTEGLRAARRALAVRTPHLKRDLKRVRALIDADERQVGAAGNAAVLTLPSGFASYALGRDPRRSSEWLDSELCGASS